jgi:hypothetical protein
LFNKWKIIEKGQQNSLKFFRLKIVSQYYVTQKKILMFFTYKNHNEILKPKSQITNSWKLNHKEWALIFFLHISTRANIHSLNLYWIDTLIFSNIVPNQDVQQVLHFNTFKTLFKKLFLRFRSVITLRVVLVKFPRVIIFIVRREKYLKNLLNVATLIMLLHLLMYT